MSHVDFSVVIYDVKGTWSADTERGKADNGGREEGKPREWIGTHKRQFLALVTESDRESGSVYIGMV